MDPSFLTATSTALGSVVGAAASIATTWITQRTQAMRASASRIRLLSADEIVRQGEACCRRIVELYGRPNLTTDQIRRAVECNEFDQLDPLKEFSNACRDELLETRIK
jgi:hypothetical protein